jgi:hypothetical protein
VDTKLLRIYLQDHLAGATGGVELARRVRGSNRGSAFGDPLARLADEIEADKKALEGVIDDLGFGADRPKNAAAWTLEKAGRLKLNGRLTGYSPLSRMVELEGLIGGVSSKISLWETLIEVSAQEPRLDRERLRRLAERGAEQRRTLEELRDRAARAAFLD